MQGRHEIINLRLIRYLHSVYWHDITQHEYVFHAVAVLVQLSIKNGDQLYSTPDYRCAVDL
jgi:hypothetical protein